MNESMEPKFDMMTGKPLTQEAADIQANRAEAQPKFDMLTGKPLNQESASTEQAAPQAAAM